MGTNTYGAIRMMADSKHFENVTISNCTITNYFQGIYLQGADGAKITNNVIDGTRHNAIALQSSAINQVQGDVLIAENIIKNVEDRVIRFGYAQQAEQISMKNNIIVNSGDSDGELFKGESFPDSEKVSLEHNYWDGRSVEIAIASKNEELRPEKTESREEASRRRLSRNIAATALSLRPTRMAPTASATMRAQKGK